MRNDNSVNWYHDRIQEKRRRATSLTIGVGLGAQDSDDPGALVETIARLDSAIRILEQAEQIVLCASNINNDDMMDDLGHSMAPFNFADAQMSAVASRDSLHFFA